MRAAATGVLCVALGVAWVRPLPASARRHPQPTPTPTLAPPTPVPTPTPLPEDVRVGRLHDALAALVARAPGRLGVTVIDPYRGARYSVNGDQMFGLASVFKLAVAIAAFRLSDDRKLSLDDRVLVTAADLRRGPSPIRDAHPRGNVTYTYWQLIRAMLAESDNTACDLVLHAVGDPPAVQHLMHELGFSAFSIRKSEADLAADARAGRAFARGGDNGATPDAVAGLLLALQTQRLLSLDATNELLLDLEAARTGPERLHAGFPAQLSLAHKTGTSDTFGGRTAATNDAGIVTLPDGRVIVVVAFLRDSPANDAARDETLANVARAVADAYVP